MGGSFQKKLQGYKWEKSWYVLFTLHLNEGSVVFYWYFAILFLYSIWALRQHRKYLMSTKHTKTFIKRLLRPEINTHCKESSKENAFNAYAYDNNNGVFNVASNPYFYYTLSLRVVLNSWNRCRIYTVVSFYILSKCTGSVTFF